jgi:putative ABC transport system permease protein
VARQPVEPASAAGLLDFDHPRIAALVSIGSFRQSLAGAIDDQARTLVGADLIADSTRPFTPEQEALLHSLGSPQARETRLSTMAVFPANGGTRLVQLRALGGDFPFYGPMETEPASAAQEFRAGGKAVADESLLIQFGAKPGDTVKIGETEFVIAGALKKVPGEASAAGSLAPRIYIALQDLGGTGLLRPGSIAKYRNYVVFPPARMRRSSSGKSVRSSIVSASNTTPSPSGRRTSASRWRIFTAS